MGIKIGDIDLANEVVELHYQNRRTQLILQEILNNTPQLYVVTPERMRELENEALTFVAEKFPNMGIKKRQ